MYIYIYIYISCNCRVKDNCPFGGKCLHECIVYQANVIANSKGYFGTAEGKFKLPHNNDTMSFQHKKRVNDTKLSKYLWKLKEENVDCNLQGASKRMHLRVNVGQENVICV